MRNDFRSFNSMPGMPAFKPRRSLAELVIIMSIVGTLGFFVIAILMHGCIDQRPGAESQARQWGRDMGLNVTNVSCANRDTDNDGYVSCTVATKNDKGDVQLHPIECAAKLTWNDGCRAPKFRVGNGR